MQGICVSPQMWVCRAMSGDRSALYVTGLQMQVRAGKTAPSTDAFTPTQVSARKRKGKKNLLSAVTACFPTLSGGGGGRGIQLQCQIQGPVDLIKSSPTSPLVKVLYAVRHFCMHLVHSFGKHEQDTCWVTSTSLGAGTIAMNKGAKEAS